jgi:hypothetical protein
LGNGSVSGCEGTYGARFWEKQAKDSGFFRFVQMLWIMVNAAAKPLAREKRCSRLQSASFQ